MNALRCWSTPLRWLVTLGALALIASRVDWMCLAAQVARADIRWVALSALLSVGVILLMAVRWKCVLRACDLDVPLRATSAVTFIGQFFNGFLPGSTGGDVVKAWYASQWAPDRRAAPAVSIFYDRLLAIITLFLITAVVLGIQATAHADLRWLFARFLYLATGALVVGLVATFALPRVARRLLEKYRQHCRLAPDAARHFLAAFAVSVPGHLVNCAAALCIARAVHLDVSFLQVAVAVAFVNCSSLLPVSIAGHGLREAGFIFVFGLYGVLGADGTNGAVFESVLAFSILFYARSLASSLPGGFCYAAFRSRTSRAADVPVPEMAPSL